MNLNLDCKPVIKRSNSASLTQDGKIIIGVVPESSIELEIKEEWISNLICLLDGNRSILDITKSLNHQGYSVQTDDVIEILESLLEANVLEDIEEYQRSLKEENISLHDATRYDRQILLFQAQLGEYKDAFKAQNKIKHARIGLVGLGGIGSYAFYALAAMGFGFIRAIDFDHIELSNLSRQILYSENDIGRLKIDIAREKSKAINSHVTYEFLNLKISNVEDAIKAIQNLDIAIIAADIPRGKIWQIFSEASFKTKIPILFLGSAQTWICCGPLIVPGVTPCYDCSSPEAVSADHPVAQFLRDRYTTTLIDPYNSIGASLGVLEAVKFITNFQDCKIIGKRLLIDLGTYETFLVSGESKKECHICGCKK